MKILVSHWDLDGVVSAILMNSIIKFDKILKGAYHRLDGFIEDIPHGADVVVTDLSLSVEQYNRLRLKSKTLVVVDHHPDTARLKELFPKGAIFFDQTKSASLACFELVRKSNKLDEYTLKNVRRLAELADVYDLWQQNHKDWKTAHGLNILFWHYKFDGFFDEFQSGFVSFAMDEEDIISQKRKEIKDKLENSTVYVELEEDGIKSLVAIPEFQSLNNEVAGFRPGFDVYYILNKFKDSTSMSVRSTLLVLNKACESLKKDCSEIILDAGGHALASGVGIDKKATVEQIFDIILLLNKKIVEFNN